MKFAQFCLMQGKQGLLALFFFNCLSQLKKVTGSLTKILVIAA